MIFKKEIEGKKDIGISIIISGILSAGAVMLIQNLLLNQKDVERRVILNHPVENPREGWGGYTGDLRGAAQRFRTSACASSCLWTRLDFAESCPFLKDWRTTDYLICFRALLALGCHCRKARGKGRWREEKRD